MAGMVVQVCRSETEDGLQQQIGAAIHHWSKLGFTKINVTYVSAGDTQAGIYIMQDAARVPQKLFGETDGDHTAALVLSTG